MSRRRDDLQSIAARTSRSAASLSRKDRVHDDTRGALYEFLYPVDRISPREGGDTRSLRADHVVDLAESIAALGLLEPIVIDSRGKLLAGAHRLAACRLLMAPPESRSERLIELTENHQASADPRLAERALAIEIEENVGAVNAVPVRQFDFESGQDPERALAIETAENAQRRDYTPTEIRALYARLKAAGYVDRRGPKRSDERPLRPAIGVVIGRSLRTVNRMLSRIESPPSPSALITRALEQLGTSVRRLQRTTGDASAVAPQVEALVRLLGSDYFQNHFEEACTALRARDAASSSASSEPSESGKAPPEMGEVSR